MVVLDSLRRRRCPLQDDNTGFVQLTVKFPSKQRFAAYDRRGRLVAGDLEKEVAGRQWQHSICGGR